MAISDWLQQAQRQLAAVGITSARLDCMILLEDITGKDRGWLLAHPEFELDKKSLKQLESVVARRAKHEPLAYIRGKVAFYGREFYVNQHVLVPRPETESFIELLKNSKLNKNNTHILDLGTGSGCIGITLALELPLTRVTLADIDNQALAVARKNADLQEAKVAHIATSLLHNITGKYDIVVANLPYVPNNYPVNAAVRFEPKLALYAGDDGLDLYRAFWRQVSELQHKPALILTESLRKQHEALVSLAKTTGYCLATTNNLVQAFELRV